MAKIVLNGIRLEDVREGISNAENTKRRVNKKEYPPIIKAVREQDIEKFVEEIKNNPECINETSESDDTPLHHAVINGQLTYVKHLIKKKAEVNAINDVGQTPLHIAVANKHLEVVKCLIESKASVHASREKERDVLTTAFIAPSSFEIFKILNDIRKTDHENLLEQKNNDAKTIEGLEEQLGRTIAELKEANSKLQKFSLPNFDIIHETPNITTKVAGDSSSSLEASDNNL